MSFFLFGLQNLTFFSCLKYCNIVVKYTQHSLSWWEKAPGFLSLCWTAIVLKKKTWQLHGKKLTCAESLLLTLFALVIALAADMANAFTDRNCCEYEFTHPGNIFSVHSWLLEPFIIASQPPPWCLCLNRDACHEATPIPAPKQNQNHNSKNIYVQFMTNCQTKLLWQTPNPL